MKHPYAQIDHRSDAAIWRPDARVSGQMSRASPHTIR